MGEGTPTTKVTRRRIIERPRLTRLLDESQGRIKMLIAPAGYGKTTLARQWLADKQAVWYTATPASADVAALAAGLGSVVSQVVPGAGDALIERLSVTSRPEGEVSTLVTMLAQDLTEWKPNSWLVVDDYQDVTGSAEAEKFIERLLVDAPLNALILARKRPRWASSRRILYGDIFELERSALAMSDTEASSVLGAAPQEMSAVLNVAHGWPAVLALAAISEATPNELMAMPQLYSFFADEIFNRLDRRTRYRLCELALYEEGGRGLALARLDSEERLRVIERGLASGFLSTKPSGDVEVHPLVQTFLQLKLRDERPQQLTNVVEGAVRTLLDHELWDEAQRLVARFDRSDLMPALVEGAMDELLATGRTATLRGWLGDSAATEPALLLAAAELAFREGRFYESEALAAHAASDLPTNPNLAARAACIAGRAAHVASRESQARGYFERAQAAATDARLSRRAALGALVVAIELEDPKAIELLDALAQMPPVDPSDEVVLADRMLAYETRFGTPVGLQNGRAASQLLRFVRDPVARTSFRNVFGYALASTGHWDEAVALTEDQLRDAERCRLDFVIPYAFTLHAMAYTGLRDYAAARTALERAEEQALHTGDLGALQMVTAVRMRTLIAQALFAEALSYGDVDMSSVTRSLRGELLCVKALALAATGHIEQARQLAEHGMDASLSVETVINGHCALAVAALNSRKHGAALTHAAAALDRAPHTGMIESLVCAYRGCPQIIVCVLERRDLHDSLVTLLNRAGDGQLATPAGSQPAENSVMSLSPREKEVLALVGQGLSNAEIGRKLFISAVTVKVHVHHIFEKLGVKSRAEAALRAAQIGRD